MERDNGETLAPGATYQLAEDDPEPSPAFAPPPDDAGDEA
jgi:hypothetical protein